MPAITQASTATKVTVGAAGIAFLNTILSLIVNFGVHLSPGQEEAITASTNAGVLLVIAVAHTLSSWHRDKTTPPPSPPPG